MSLVLGYADSKRAIIMSDGRAVGEQFRSETYDKTIKINKNIIIGFAGIKESIEIFINHIFCEIENERELLFADDLIEILGLHMQEPETRKNLLSTFLIVGKTEKGHMVTAIAGQSTNFCVEKNSVTSARILSIGGSVDGRRIEEIYRKNMKAGDMGIKERMENTILEVSKIDNSVNKTIFMKTI